MVQLLWTVSQRSRSDQPKQIKSRSGDYPMTTELQIVNRAPTTTSRRKFLRTLSAACGSTLLEHSPCHAVEGESKHWFKTRGVVLMARDVETYPWPRTRPVTHANCAPARDDIFIGLMTLDRCAIARTAAIFQRAIKRSSSRTIFCAPLAK